MGDRGRGGSDHRVIGGINVSPDMRIFGYGDGQGYGRDGEEEDGFEGRHEDDLLLYLAHRGQ